MSMGYRSTLPTRWPEAFTGTASVRKRAETSDASGTYREDDSSSAPSFSDSSSDISFGSDSSSGSDFSGGGGDFGGGGADGSF